MMKPSKVMLLAIGLLFLAACAGQPHREEPHHYSKGQYGDRVACYKTDVVNEYECLPVDERYARHYYYPYDPFWPFFSFGVVYGIHHHGHVAYYPYPYWRHHRHHRHRHGRR